MFDFLLVPQGMQIYDEYFVFEVMLSLFCPVCNTHWIKFNILPMYSNVLVKMHLCDYNASSHDQEITINN